MHRVTAVIGVVAILAYAACGKDATAPPEPGTPADVAGTWQFSQGIGNDLILCSDYGTINFSQSQGDLTGTGNRHTECQTSSGFITDSARGSVSGSVGSQTIRLAFAGCEYHGNLFHVPADSAAGTVTCKARPGLGRLGNGTFSGSWSATFDIAPPTIGATVIYPQGDVLAVTGETVRIALSAHDKHGVRLLGYDLVPPANVRDSVAVSDTAVADTFALPVTGSWEGTAYMHVWASNAYHKSAFEGLGQVTVLNAIRRPSQTTVLGILAPDAVFDPAHNVMYFTQPDSSRVAVLELGTFTLDAPIPLPMIGKRLAVQNIDVTPGGDTVIVPLPDSALLAFLDRIANRVTTSRVSVGGVRGIDRARVTANRKVLMIGQVDSAGSSVFVVVERDLATGQDSIRRDVGHVSQRARLWGSPDQSKVLVLTEGPPSCGSVYDAATDAFSPCVALNFTTAPATATTHGDKWLIGDQLVDGSLQPIATVGGGGMSPDGSVGYEAAGFGYGEVAFPTRATIERVRIPGLQANPNRFIAVPGGDRLILLSEANGALAFITTQVTVVELAH